MTIKDILTVINKVAGRPLPGYYRFIHLCTIHKAGKLLLAFFLIISVCVYAQDTAITAGKKAGRKNSGITEFERLIKYYRYYKQDSAVYYSQQAIAFARKLERERSILISRITLAGILVFLMVTGLLYYQYRWNQRTNTEISDKNQSLQRLLAEKEWLLKEVHHRVKNNLQLVISLLNTQSKYLDSKEAKEAIRESKHRMEAMSLIHQKLYKSENATSVHMRAYIAELAEYLTDSFNAGKQIQFHLQVEAIELDIALAIPVALILNETITNALKYAFPNKAKGLVTITMQYAENGNMILKVNDNGIGMPEGFDAGSGDSMGMRLIKGLVKQLDGKLVIRNEPGACILIHFKPDTILKSISIDGLPKGTEVLS